MKNLLEILKKYIVLLVIWSAIGIVWAFVQPMFLGQNLADVSDLETYSLINSLPNYLGYLIRFIIAILLLADFKKYNLNHKVLTFVVTLFYPLLGVVIFALLLMGKSENKAGTQQWL